MKSWSQSQKELKIKDHFWTLYCFKIRHVYYFGTKCDSLWLQVCLSCVTTGPNLGSFFKKMWFLTLALLYFCKCDSVETKRLQKDTLKLDLTLKAQHRFDSVCLLQYIFKNKKDNLQRLTTSLTSSKIFYKTCLYISSVSTLRLFN